jgi:hypothetical protein
MRRHDHHTVLIPSHVASWEIFEAFCEVVIGEDPEDMKPHAHARPKSTIVHRESRCIPDSGPSNVAHAEAVTLGARHNDRRIVSREAMTKLNRVAGYGAALSWAKKEVCALAESRRMLRTRM